jgi:hypothetical protein
LDVSPDEVIDVVCVVLPDGTVQWIPKATLQQFEDVIAKWKAALPKDTRDRYHQHGVFGGFVTLRMFARDVPQRGGTPEWLSQALNEGDGVYRP